MADKPSKLTLVRASDSNSPEAEARVHAVTMDIARLLGRQLARELSNDALPTSEGEEPEK